MMVLKKSMTCDYIAFVCFIIITKAEHSSQGMEIFYCCSSDESVKKIHGLCLYCLCVIGNIFITQAEHRDGNFPDNGMYLYLHKF